MGRGHYRNYWTKSRGRVEVGEGGGFSWGGAEGWVKMQAIVTE